MGAGKAGLVAHNVTDIFRPLDNVPGGAFAFPGDMAGVGAIPTDEFADKLDGLRHEASCLEWLRS
jgi:hypothetical protein